MIALKQGAGRLIRDKFDKGVLVICDNRLVTKDYGKTFVSSLPNMKRTRDLDQVVSPNFMLEAKDFFIRNNIEIETHLIKNCDHHIPIEASSIALNYILKKIK